MDSTFTRFKSDPLVTVWNLFLNNNFSQLDGNFARSAQPGLAQLKRVNSRVKPKVVLNLRGGHEGDWWYEDEVDFCREKGIKLIDFKLTAKRLPEREEVLEILDILDGEKPIYVHCRGGCERTGLVSTIYEHVVKGFPIDVAMRQLSLRFGVIGPMGSFQKEFFRMYRRDSGRDFEKWVREQYDGLTHLPEVPKAL